MGAINMPFFYSIGVFSYGIVESPFSLLARMALACPGL